MTIILPETEMPEAILLAEKLCATVRNHSFIGVHGDKLSVTTSIGVTAFHTDLDSPNQMVEAADQALYRAKENGRDQVISSREMDA